MNTTSTSIHPETVIGYVHLTVSDLERSLAFYQDILGFRLHRRDGNTARLGSGGPDLLWLTEQLGASSRPPRTTGLYHFAILVPSRADLARVLLHLVETRTTLQGLSDHLVSEAIYLADPDGNGIEIYSDRPRADWQFEGALLRMTTQPLDVAGLQSELLGREDAWGGLPAETVIGHMHLHVANLAEAEAFYVGVLEFDIMQRYGSQALFVSAGGYHHHIGLNTWAGIGAPPPPPDAAGLRTFVVRLPDEVELARLTNRVSEAGVAFEETPDGALVRDPSHNYLLLASATSMIAKSEQSKLR
jgi:catechol 2,3-dioxygenase